MLTAAQMAQTAELAGALSSAQASPKQDGRPLKTLVMEHKTSSEDIGAGSIYWRKLTLDAQISNYMVGARSLGFEPEGVLYDVLRKTALRPYEVNSKRSVPETPQDFRDRVLDDIAKRPDYYYQRGIVVRLEDEERDAAFDTWQTADQIRISRNENRWPRNVDACSQYSRLCEYWPVCSGEASINDPLRFGTEAPNPELDATRHLPVLTSSSARTFRACARRYYYANELGVRPRGPVAAPLHFGRRIHLALEAWLSHGRDLDAALAAIASTSYNYDAARAEAMMRGYHARWADESIEVLAVEKEFSCALINPATGAPSRTFVRAGKLDAIVRA